MIQNHTENTADTAFAEPVQFRMPETAGNNMKLTVFQENLANSLKVVDNEVMKGYISDISDLELVAPDVEQFNKMAKMQFFRISEMVYEKNEFSVHKLSTVFHTLSNKPCTLALMIRSDGITNEFYLGVRSFDKRSETGTMRQMLEQSLTGIFPGSRLERYDQVKLKKDLSDLRSSCKSITGVTCIADYKKNESDLNNDSFIQGLEKFIQSMSGKRFTTIIIANNISKSDLAGIKHEYESIYSQLSPFSNMQISFSDSSSQTSGTSSSRGITKSTTTGSTHSKNKSNTRSVTDTTGTTRSTSDTDTTNSSTSVGSGTSDSVAKSISVSNTTSVSTTVGATAGVPGIASASVSASVGNSTTLGTSRTTSHAVSKMLTNTTGTSHSLSVSNGTNESSSVSDGTTEGTTDGYSYAVGNAFNIVNGESCSDTFGSTQGITLNAENMTLKNVMNKLRRQLERIEESESLGMWECASYFLGDMLETTATAANVYCSIISGNQSGVEASGIHVLGDANRDGAKKIEQLNSYLLNFIHPMFIYNGFDYDGTRPVIVDPSAMVTTNELAIQMGLPRRSVKGLPVAEHSAFAQEIVPINREQKLGDEINLGYVYHLGEKTRTPLRLDKKSLAMHTFVTGSTGSGKSNAVYQLLSELRRNNVPFLVVEPAKGEYGSVFSDVNYFCTNPKSGRMLKINPFAFPENIHVLEHIDRLAEIFNVCWPMYAAMPAVLKSSIEQAYISAGWDIDVSENSVSENLFPTFSDVVKALTEQIEQSAYSGDTKGDYIGSLSTRLKSLTTGINGRIFSGSEQDLSELFDKSAIIDISRIGDSNTKSLIMGIIILKLQEYRISHSELMNVPLKHVTVLEEAHNILKRTSKDQSQDSANIIGKSVEMLTNTIAEIRTYGEGFIIADQSPGTIDAAAIRNTNTKIVFKLPDGSDRETAGLSIGITDEQIAELAKLPTGVAAVYQNNWQEAILCNLNHYKITDKKRTCDAPDKKYSKADKNDPVLHKLISKYIGSEVSGDILSDIVELEVPAGIRRSLINNIDSRNAAFEYAMADLISYCYDINSTFANTGSGLCRSVNEVEEVALRNISRNFTGFDSEELKVILHFICLSFFEKNPDNDVIKEIYLERPKIKC